MNENIFDYDMTFIETEVINPDRTDKESYLKRTPVLKKLSDLHLLFLIRRDKENCDRIMEMIKQHEDMAEIINQKTK
jgi:hypothetical protein